MVSIIIPTYNYALYIGETLDSIVNQSYANWECIIVDDGSTDNTREVVQYYTALDNRFKYVQQQNQGVSAARNTGLKLSKGEFIQFLDGDDLLQLDKIKSQVQAFEKNPSADIVYNDVRFFDNNASDRLRISFDKTKSERWLPKLSEKGASVVAGFCKLNFLVINSPLIRKNIFSKVGFFDEAMHALEDWDFWMRCALSDSYFYYNTTENGAYALVRVHYGSLSTQKKLMNNSHFLFLQHALNHKNIGTKNAFVLLAKYVELFWDSIFTKFYFAAHSFLLAAFSVLMLPFYVIIKLIRLFR